MSIYDPLAEALGIEPNPNFKYETFIFIPDEFNSQINREEAIKRNAEKVECDRCGVIGNRPNMMRWHFDNCKTSLKECKECGKTIPRQGIKDYLYNQKTYCNRKCYMKSKVGKPPIVMTDDIKEKLSRKAKERWKRS